ncbi:MAG: hypothetical protein LBU30_04755 [Candidatus Methanoplasma sp.]|nr:hypothetical protein [Candidatus Methanoplasma sp.]
MKRGVVLATLLLTVMMAIPFAVIAAEDTYADASSIRDPEDAQAAYDGKSGSQWGGAYSIRKMISTICGLSMMR